MTLREIYQAGGVEGPMANRVELNERALMAASLRRKKMAIADIARYLSTPERQVYRYLKRAEELYRLLANDTDPEKYLGERLTVFLEMESEALAKFATLDPKSSVALGYLNAARDAAKQIKVLLQESGMMTKVAERLKVTGIPSEALENDEIRADIYSLLKINELLGKNRGGTR
jgi:hypothetical protein